MKLDPDSLPPRTRALFERLRREPRMAGLTLVGGSALALQIGHRLSEDLDFAVFGSPLPTPQIDALMQSLEQEGRQVILTTSQSAMERFRINTGKRLLNLARDYAVDGARLTFFVRTTEVGVPQAQVDWFRTAPRLPAPPGFDILGTDGLFAMKALLLADRARSRDLYDLMVLIRDHGYTLEHAFHLVQTLAPIEQRDIERHKAVLTGILPLDREDEGFHSIGLNLAMTDIHAFFSEQIDRYEQELARATIARARQTRET